MFRVKGWNCPHSQNRALGQESWITIYNMYLMGVIIKKLVSYWKQFQVGTKTTTFFTQTFSIARPLLLTATVYESKLISNLLCEINAIQHFNALGFFVVDLSTFTSIISTALTYLVIITQFYASYDNCPFSSSVMNSTLV